MKTKISDEAVATVLREVDDLEYGAGVWPDDWRPYCHKCEEEIGLDEMMGVAFGSYYHASCVPSLQDGPMPLGQYLGGVCDAR